MVKLKVPTAWEPGGWVTFPLISYILICLYTVYELLPVLAFDAYITHLFFLCFMSLPSKKWLIISTSIKSSVQWEPERGQKGPFFHQHCAASAFLQFSNGENIQCSRFSKQETHCHVKVGNLHTCKLVTKKMGHWALISFLRSKHSELFFFT